MIRSATIIILNYNNHKSTIECLKSLKLQTYTKFNIILIDNASRYNLFLELKREIKQFETDLNINLIRNNFNSYFTGANNKALKIAKGDYICLLNNDTVVMPDFIEKMISFLEDHPEAYMISPKIKIYKDKDYLWYAGAEIDLRKFDIVKIRGLWEHDPKNQKYNEITITGYIAGTAVFLRRDILNKVGLLDEILFMYHDDPDWSLRAKKKGYNIYYVPNTIVYHDVSRTIDNKRNTFNKYFIIRNSQILVWKHGTLKDLVIYYIKFCFTNVLDIIFYFRIKKIDLVLIRLNAILRGFRIGLKRKTNRSCRKYIVKDYYYVRRLQDF